MHVAAVRTCYDQIEGTTGRAVDMQTEEAPGIASRHESRVAALADHEVRLPPGHGRIESRYPRIAADPWRPAGDDNAQAVEEGRQRRADPPYRAHPGIAECDELERVSPFRRQTGCPIEIAGGIGYGRVEPTEHRGRIPIEYRRG